MTTRQENQQLKDQIKFLEAKIALLDKKIEQQSQEILRAKQYKSQLSALRKKNKRLEDEKFLLETNLMDYQEAKTNIVDVRVPQMKQQIAMLKRAQVKLEAEVFQKANKIGALEYELKQTKAFTVNLPPYGEIPKEVFDNIQDLKKKLRIANDNYNAAKELKDALLRHLEDKDLREKAEEYLNIYNRKRRGAKQKITPEKIETIRQLREGGMSIRDIAAAVGAGVGSVYRYLKQNI